LDLRLGRSLRASFEARDRELSIESSLADSAVVPAQNQDEHNYFGILHWTFATETVAALSFEDDRFSWAATVPTDDPVDLRTRTTAVALRTALGVHWFGEATTRYVDQRVTRQAGSPAPAGKETFATTDIALGYRFPRRRGTMTLSVQNLFDQTFSYQDNNFRTNEAVWPLYTPARTIVYKVVLSF
jgi:outer membrane receptor protein involved in Fe transport